MSNLAPRNVDHAKVFLAYLSLQGDVNRTALACDMEVEEVRDLALAEQWATKLEQFAALRESDQNFTQPRAELRSGAAVVFDHRRRH